MQGSGPASRNTTAMKLYAHHSYAFYLAERIANVLAERY